VLEKRAGRARREWRLQSLSVVIQMVTMRLVIIEGGGGSKRTEVLMKSSAAVRVFPLHDAIQKGRFWPG
jgi:hypothetical protein